MSGTTRQKVRTPTVAETTGEDHKDDVYTDENEPTVVLTKEGNNNAVHQETSVDLEEGSPPSHPPHVIRDGGFTAWSTTLGAYVE